MLFSKTTKPLLDRIENDSITKLRLRYAPYYHVVDSIQGAQVQVAGRSMIMMSSNEYIGLSQHPQVIAAAQKAMAEWGTSSCGSRLANGSRRYHIELEEELAVFLGKEACHVIVAGYLGCMGSLTAIAQKGDALIVDRSIHSSLWDGAHACPADVERFSHEDMNSLELLLSQLDPKQAKVIAVDGVYSMEGHLASIPDLVRLYKKHQAMLIVDDAHGLGCLGREGRGVVDHFQATDDVDLIVGSFSKSLASTGGFMAGSKAMIEYQRSNCRQIIFSAAISPGQSAAALASLRIMQAEPQHQKKLWENVIYLRQILDQLGLDYWKSPTPAMPILIGNKERCFYFWKSLWDQGFFTVMSTSPGVPVGKDLIRTAVSSLHSTEMLDRFGDALKVAMKKAGVKPGSHPQ
jgi:8-amino-7-oxononanoate synthase